MELVDVDDAIFWNRATDSTKPAFTSVSAAIRALTVDASCERVRMFNFLINGDPDNETTISSADSDNNYFEFYDVNTAAWDIKGRWRQGLVEMLGVFQPFNVKDASGNNIFRAEPGNGLTTAPHDAILRNFAEQALYLILDAGVAADQARVIRFTNQGGLVSDFEIQVSAAGSFSIRDVVAPDTNRLAFTQSGSSDYRTGSTSTNHAFGHAGR